MINKHAAKVECSVCGQQSSNKLGHTDPWACIAALKLKLFELQGQVERQARAVPSSYSVYTEQERDLFGSPGDGEIDIRGKE